MHTTWRQRWVGGICFLLLFAGLGSGTVTAQSALRSGYTKPGSPSDTEIEGKIVFIGHQKDAQTSAMGGKVLFMVLQRQGEGPDPWGAGIKDFVQYFQPGIDFSGGSSPNLDTKAKYLYLYQVVNSRGTQVPLHSASIKLLVELRDITSWGYFDSLGFRLPPGEKEKDAGGRIRPISYDTDLSGDDAGQGYRRRAPAIHLEQPFRLTLVPTEGSETPAIGDKKTKPIIAKVTEPIDPSINPTYVMLLESTPEFRNQPCFRAIWSKKGLEKDRRSTVFGFTSNLPPTMEAVLVKTPVKAEGKEDSGIRPAVADPAEAAALEGPVAEGRVPTPVPETPAVAYAPPMESFAPPPMPAAGGGAAPALTVGALGASRPPSGGGGGGGFMGSGGGTGEGTTTEEQKQGGANNPINFKATLVNQQQQAQQQRQSQSQTQTNCCNVIPAPASVLLTALGLPALWWLGRKRRCSVLPRAKGEG